MQLTVRDVGRFLGVPESTIVKWIKQRGLPAQRVGGQYHFNRAELLDWATSQKIKVSVELFDQGAGEAAPSLLAALEAGGIHYGLQSPDKETTLRALVEVLPLPETVDRPLLLSLFSARETLASTGIGGGIALPHVRNPIVLHVARPLITLAFLARPVAFGALDGQPVHVLFCLVSPTVPTHLQLLSRLSFALHDAAFRDTVVRHGSQEEVLAQVRRVEAGFPTPGAKPAATPPGAEGD